MYNLISAVALSMNDGQRWSSINAATMTVMDLFSQYRRVILNLTTNFAPTVKIHLELDKLKAQQSLNDATLAQFLVSNGNTALPTELGHITIKTKIAQYMDGVRAGFKITPIDESAVLDSPTPIADRQWLALTRANTDYRFLQSHCLVSINGMIHRTDTDGNKLIVVDGMKSSRLAKLNQLGVTSFNEISSLEILPITANMIHKRYANVPMSTVTYLDAGRDLSNKNVGLVLGGYLHLFDQNTFYRISDSIFAIDFQNFPMAERYYESKSLIDLSSLDLDKFTGGEEVINRPELFSDETLTKYVTLSQSFFVIFDEPELFIEIDPIPRSRIPDIFTVYQKPKYPMVCGYGKLADYWRVEEKPYWAVHTRNACQENFLFQTNTYDDINNIGNDRDPMQPAEYGRAHFIKIGVDLKKTIG